MRDDEKDKDSPVGAKCPCGDGQNPLWLVGNTVEFFFEPRSDRN